MSETAPAQTDDQATAQIAFPPDIDSLPDSHLLTGYEVDAYLKCSTSHRLRLEKAGRLKVHRFGRFKRYMVRDLRACVAASCEAA